MAETARIQYVFLDVVGFTHKRSVEAQSDIVETLNAVVKNSLVALQVPEDKTVLLPTGDGMAIALIDIAGVDLHLRLALQLLTSIAGHNGSIGDQMRRFEVRIGINENIDNVLPDINGRRNVAGSGISLARRIMDKADGGHVLVSASVFEILRQRELYFSTWRAFTARGKHGVVFPVYQFVSKNVPGLNIGVPAAFAPKRREPEKLTLFAAYYLGHAIANRDFLLSLKSDSVREYVATVLLAFLAEDSVEAFETPDHQEPPTVTWKAGSASFEEQYNYYRAVEFWVIARLAGSIHTVELGSFSELFEQTDADTFYWSVTPKAVAKLVADWPIVAGEFGITAELAS